MSSWNYRVMCHEYDGEISYCIHEVYYDDDGKVTGWTQSASALFGESVEELIRDAELMSKAIKLPILDFESGLLI